MIAWLIWAMGKGERPPIVIDLCEMVVLPAVVWLGIIIYRRMRKVQM
jgi:hypothetical protein